MTDGPRRQVAVGLIVDDGGCLLLQHRDADPAISGAGLWGFFGGHLEPGEAASRAFLREMDEELGWRPRHFEHYRTTNAPPLPGDKDYGGGVVSHVFAAHLDVSLDALTLGEGQAMALFAPDALPAEIVPGLVPVIDEFASSQAYRRVRHRYDNIFTLGLIVDAAGRFLLQHRDDKPGISNPGKWGSFGGSLEPYETPEEGFLREIAEELQWRPSSMRLSAGTPYVRDGSRRLVYAFAAPLGVPIDKLQLCEGQGMDLFPPDALPSDTVPDLRTLIQRFAATPMYMEMARRAAEPR